MTDSIKTNRFELLLPLAAVLFKAIYRTEFQRKKNTIPLIQTNKTNLLKLLRPLECCLKQGVLLCGNDFSIKCLTISAPCTKNCVSLSKSERFSLALIPVQQYNHERFQMSLASFLSSVFNEVLVGRLYGSFRITVY